MESNTMQNLFEKIREFLPAGEHYFWVALLKNEGLITQYDAEGGYHTFKEVQIQEETNNLKAIAWIPADKTRQEIWQYLDGDRRAILFIRHKKKIGSSGVETHEKIYAIGWQATIKGKNVKSITFIYPDGKIRIGEGV